MRRAILVLGFLLTLCGGLSVHVIMLQGFNVPYPGHLPAGGWARLPDRLLSTFGAVTLYAMLGSQGRVRPVLWRCGFIFLVLGMIHETLFRLPLMNIVTASKWNLYPFLDEIPAYGVLAVLVISIGLCGRFLASTVRRVAATVLIGVPVYLLVAPGLQSMFAGLQAWTSAREGYTFYNPPYDWHVEIPAYITFAEPVLAAFLVARFVSGALPRNTLRAGMTMALLIFALRGQFFSMFTNIAYAGTDAATAMLSFGQFTLESLTLAVLTSATWSLLPRSPEQPQRVPRL